MEAKKAKNSYNSIVLQVLLMLSNKHKYLFIEVERIVIKQKIYNMTIAEKQNRS